MSVYGSWKAATVAINTATSSEVDLGRSYDYLEIQIPAVDSGTVSIQVAEKTGGTFYTLGDGVTTETGTHNYADCFFLGGYQFIKVITSATQTTERLIRVRGASY